MSTPVATSDAAPLPSRGGYGRRALTALAHAEFLQFRRNKTLMFMGTVFPIGLPLVMFFIGTSNSEPKPLGVALTMETFAFSALLFVVYYSILSMVTTRRSEGVLKRLRTGEASDWQILTAPAIPGAILALVGAAIVSAVVYLFGAPAPVNPVLMILALLAGIVIFALLALATTAMTKNAEAAQITSIPVIMIAVLGMSSIRTLLPERLQTIADWSPFAAVSDLIMLGQAGLAPGTEPDLTGGGGVADALSFADSFTAIGRPLATLALWTVISLVLVKQYFRWDDRG